MKNASAKSKTSNESTILATKPSTPGNLALTAIALLGVSLLLLFAHFAQSGSSVDNASSFFSVWQRARVWVGALFCLAGAVLLMKFKVTYYFRAFLMILIFLVFAIIPELQKVLPQIFTYSPQSLSGKFFAGMAIHPSPMCIVTKPFGFLAKSQLVPYFFMALFLAILVMTMVANKMFCGWVCPIGAVQELFFKTPFNKKPKFKLPFLLTNSIRITVFIIFIDLIFSASVDVYERFNPFEYFHWQYEAITIRALAIILAASFFIFRPFCYLFCPLGLLTWVFEHFSLMKVRLNKAKCTNCNLCLEKSPCPTIPSILNEKIIRPDCHPCGRCLEVCPEKALEFRA